MTGQAATCWRLTKDVKDMFLYFCLTVGGACFWENNARACAGFCIYKSVYSRCHFGCHGMGVFVFVTLTRLHGECEESLHVIVVVLWAETPPELLGKDEVRYRKAGKKLIHSLGFYVVFWFTHKIRKTVNFSTTYVAILGGGKSQCEGV